MLLRTRGASFSMAALSRGAAGFFHPHTLRLPGALRATLIQPRLHAARTKPLDRPFSTSIFRSYAPSARASYPSAGTYMGTDPVLRAVRSTRQPVLLYQEPPRRNYLWKIYGMATLCTGIGLFNFYFVQKLPEGLSWFVAPTYMVIGVCFLAIGIHIYQRPVRRITTLEVIPGSMGGGVQLRLRGKKEPWAKETVIETEIWNATIGEKTRPMISEIVEAERARRQSITQELEHLSIIPKAWEIAARWIEQKWTSFFLRFKFAVLQFGETHIEIDGVKWKLDCRGYLREEGAAVDRLLPVE